MNKCGKMNRLSCHNCLNLINSSFGKKMFWEVDHVTTQGENKKWLGNLNGLNGSSTKKQKDKWGKKIVQGGSTQ
jgi:hypothetical protein